MVMTLMPRTEAVTENKALEEDIGIAPESYLPLIYSKEESYAWLGEKTSSKISNLDEGYLYVLNEATNDLTKVLEEPVVAFAESHDFLFAATNTHKIVCTNYTGSESTVIYTAKYGSLAALNYKNAMLYFSDGNTIVQMNTATGETKAFMCE